MTGGLDWRYELKLVCDSRWLPQARAWIRLHPAGFITAYPPRRVNSLYLDTLRLSNFDDNLSGVGLRHKLRLRWYGELLTDIQPTLELKQKRNLLGRKKQTALPKLDLSWPWTDILATLRANVGPEWQIRLQTTDWPALLNHYQRDYYATPDGVIRVTLDYDQVAYDQRLALGLNWRARLPIDDTIVIEIKTGQDQTERLRDIVARFPLPRSRNSKYAGGVLAAVGWRYRI